MGAKETRIESDTAEPVTGVVAGTLVEAVDGPAAIEELVGKGMPVLTRLAAGGRGFRILSKITASEERVPVVRLGLDNGRTVEVAAEQLVYNAAGTPVRALDLRPGDRLLASFHYPPGYRIRDGGAPHAGDEGKAGIAVLSVEAGPQSFVYRGSVRDTGCMFLSTGILCKF